MADKILTDDRKCCTARVTVSVEVVVKPVWGTWSLDDVYADAAKNASEKVQKACDDFGTVRSVSVQCVLTEDHEVKP